MQMTNVALRQPQHNTYTMLLCFFAGQLDGSTAGAASGRGPVCEEPAPFRLRCAPWMWSSLYRLLGSKQLAT